MGFVFLYICINMYVPLIGALRMYLLLCLVKPLSLKRN